MDEWKLVAGKEHLEAVATEIDGQTVMVARNRERGHWHAYVDGETILNHALCVERMKSDIASFVRGDAWKRVRAHRQGKVR